MSESSIHPRNWNTGNRVVKNTCKPRNNNRKGKLGKASANLARRRLDHAATLRDKSIKNPMAFKSPGSMNEHK